MNIKFFKSIYLLTFNNRMELFEVFKTPRMLKSASCVNLDNYIGGAKDDSRDFGKKYKDVWADEISYGFETLFLDQESITEVD